MDMTFRASKGSMIDDDQAQRYGERIVKLELQNRDSTDFPGIVIEDGKNENSPLNEYFEWDNKIAGDKFRRHQAQLLLCWIHVEIINPQTEETEVTRAFHPIKITQQDEEKTIEVHTWTTTERILSDSEMRRQIIEKAIGEIDSWRKRYEQYTELSTIFDAIQQLRLNVTV